MPELRLEVSDETIEAIRNNLKTINGFKPDEAFPISLFDMGREALGLYRWTLERMAKDGLALCTTRPDGTLVHQVETSSTRRREDYIMPSIDRQL